jgi:hypothetical protein
METDKGFCGVNNNKIPPVIVNHLTMELNPSAQRCLMRFFTGDFAS